MEKYRVEIEELAADLRKLAGRRAENSQLLKCAQLRALPHIDLIRARRPSERELIEAIRDEILLGLGSLRGTYRLETIDLAVTAAQVREAIRIEFGLKPGYGGSPHHIRRNDAIQILRASGDAESWRRPGEGPELDLMRILAASLYSLNYDIYTRFHIDSFYNSQDYDEHGRLAKEEYSTQIRAAVEGLDSITTYVRCLDDPRPEVCHYEPVSGCFIKSVEPTHEGIKVAVGLAQTLGLDETLTVNYRTSFNSDVVIQRPRGLSALHAVDAFGEVSRRVVFHDKKTPSQISWFAVPRGDQQPNFPDVNQLLNPISKTIYERRFGAVRRGWFCGFVWTW